MTLGELATFAGVQRIPPAAARRKVRRAAVLENADATSVSFCAETRHTAALAATGAGACFVPPALAGAVPAACVALVTDHPQAAWAAAADRLHRPRAHAVGGPSLSPDAALEEGVQVGPGVVVGAGATIGRGAVLAPGAVIGPGVAIGRDTHVGANASIAFALIGDGVRIWAGAVIGEAGFGAALGPRGLVDIPQLGRVIVQDGVTLGAGTCVDRGAYGDTVIGENTKIDNLVQIAHNVRIGRNCLLAAHTGISGSVEIGDGCLLGGRVGIADHLTVGAGARIAAASGVMSHVPAGETWAGYPARPRLRWLREAALVARLARSERTARREP